MTGEVEVEDYDQFISWLDNGTHVCHNDTKLDESWCGVKDSCTQKGLLLPLFQEVTWSKELRAVLYFIGLLYRQAPSRKKFKTFLSPNDDAPF